MKKKLTLYMLLVFCLTMFFSVSVRADWSVIEGKTYYLQNGVKLTDWQRIGKYTYYFGKDGVSRRGWQIIQGARYYFNKKNGRMFVGVRRINGVKYTFDSSGRLIAHAAKHKAGTVQKTGWKTVDGKVGYYVNGVLQTNSWIKQNGKRMYYVQADGTRASGILQIGKRSYYFNPANGKLQRGLFQVNGKYYYAHAKKGYLYMNQFLKAGKYRYYASADGSLLKGLQTIGARLYYFGTKKARMAVSKKVKVDGSTYFFNKNGIAVTGKWKKIKGKRYYFGEDGRMAVSTTVGGYRVGADGARTGKADTFTGWKTVNGAKCYYVNGDPATGWQTIGGSQYYMLEGGKMATGIQEIAGKKYYFYPTGILSTGVTLAVGVKEYTINKNGVVTAEKTINVSGTNKGAQIAKYALNFVGNRYVYGGTSLTNGADCSGFVMSVFANYGIKVLRVADAQMKGPSAAQISSGYHKAVVVNQKDILPGDLVFYGSSNYASHVGIYIGDSKIVHASNSQPYPAGGIKISTWNYNTPVRIVRYWS